ncbi:MAG: DUF1992 domain-containing protein [Desulfobacteraceae bacterium]|nr:DUF1992 domain-containing protein [Desulfobacteraceae bacterium]
MIPGFEKLVEERIKKAQKEGAFKNLEGAKKPLKFDDENVPEEFRLSNKILKNAGFLPPEVELKKQITHVEQLMENIEPDSPKKGKLQKKLNYLLTKLQSTRRNGSGFSMHSELYRKQMLKKLS